MVELKIIPSKVEQINSYNQLVDETDLQYEKFLMFCIIGETRTLEKSYKYFCEKYSKKSEDFIPGSWKKLYRNFKWFERSIFWDDSEQDRQLRQQIAIETQAIQQLKKDKELIAKSCVKGGTLLLKACGEKIEKIKSTDISLKILPQLVKTAIILTDLGITAWADCLGIQEILSDRIIQNRPTVEEELISNIQNIKKAS